MVSKYILTISLKIMQQLKNMPLLYASISPPRPKYICKQFQSLNLRVMNGRDFKS